MRTKRLITSVVTAMSLLALGCMTATVTSCKQDAEILVKSVKVDQSAIVLTEGETATISYTLEPDNAMNKVVKFSTSDASVATVNDRGIVTAVSAGKATITVASVDGPQATVLVSVQAKTIAVTGVSLDKEELTLTEGDVATLKATVSPDNAADKSVSWKSSNESIATVSDGIVTGVKAGTAVITVTTNDGGYTATCVVTVESAVVSVTGVSLDKSELTLVEGETATLNATVTPADATDKEVTWSSSQPSVATVTDGVIVAVAPGSTAITVTTNDGGKTATCAVTVVAKTVSVTGVSLDKTELTLVEGETATLTATVTPADASDKSVSWKSSQPGVATVTDGVVVAVAPGTTAITVTTNDGGKTATCAVTVEKKVVEVTGVSVDIKDVTLVEGEDATIKVTIEPADATDQTVTFSSSDESVATVDENGKITAVGPGTATITVTAGGKTATTTVTVTPAVIPATGVTVDVTDVTLVEGGDTTIKVTVEPADATDEVTFSSSDESVATVDENGKITAVGPGTATITITAGGVSTTTTVTVTATPVAVTGVKLDKSDVTIGVGDEVTLVATVSPADATDKSVKWSSSASSVASVDENGKVTGLKTGSATITVTTNDGGKKATCKVTVTAASVPVGGVSLNKTSLSLAKGASETLVATVVPAEATNKAVTWSSTNPSIASVDNNGKVTAVEVGSATITVTTESGGFTASCDVTVTATAIKVTGVSVVPNMITVAPGDVTTLTVTVLPSDATNKNVSWKSSKESVATVDENGKVTAITPGSATITVTTEDGGYTATCTVTVEAQSYEFRSYCLEDGSNYNGITNVIHYQYGLKYGSAAASSFYIVAWNTGEHAVAKDAEASHFTVSSSNTSCVTASVEKLSGYYAILVKAVADPSDSGDYSDLSLKYVDVGGTEITKDVRVCVAPSKASSAFQYDLYTYDGTNTNTAGSTYSHILSKSDASFVRLFTRYKGIAAAGSIPDREDMATYSWSSSNTSVVSISKKTLSAPGTPYPELTFKGPGTSTVKYNYTDYKGNKLSKSIVFTVTANYFSSGDYVSTSASYKDNSSSKPYTPTSTTVKLNIYKSSGTAYGTDELSGITWTSGNTSVATVSGSGTTATVTIKAGGSVTITAKDGSGDTRNFYISCFKWSDGDYVTGTTDLGYGKKTSSSDPWFMAKGYTQQIYSLNSSSTAYSESSAAKVITWKSKNTSIATVSPSAGASTKVTGVAAGTAEIVGIDSFGNTRSFWVMVYDLQSVSKPFKVAISNRSGSITHQMKRGVDYIGLPDGYSSLAPSNLSWSSSNTSVATVNSSGLVTMPTTTSTVTATITGKKDAGFGVVSASRTFKTVGWHMKCIYTWSQVSSGTPVAGNTYDGYDSDEIKIDAGSGFRVRFVVDGEELKGNYYTVTQNSNTSAITYAEPNNESGAYYVFIESNKLTDTGSSTINIKYDGPDHYVEKRFKVTVIDAFKWKNTGDFIAPDGEGSGPWGSSSPFYCEHGKSFKMISYETGVGYYRSDAAKKIQWTSSDTSIATVSPSNGYETTVTLNNNKAGIACITATDSYGNTRTCYVTNGYKFGTNDVVVPSGGGTSEYTSSNPYFAKFSESYKMQIWTSVSPYNQITTAAKYVQWSSSNTNIATVSPSSGYETTVTMSGSNNGTSTITGTDSWGQKRTCVVGTAFRWASGDVIGCATGGKIPSSSDPWYLVKGRTVVVSPQNSSQVNYTGIGTKSLKWSSSSTSIITVSPSQGSTTTITAVGTGTATVTGTDMYGNTRTFYVLVYEVSSNTTPFLVATSKKSGNITHQMTLGVDYFASPSSTFAVSNYEWSSSNTSVATVSSSGLVTIPRSTSSSGSATITGAHKKSLPSVSREFRRDAWGFKCIQSSSGGVTVGQEYNSWDNDVIKVTSSGNIRLRFYMSSGGDLKGNHYTYTLSGDSSSSYFGIGTSNTSQDGYYLYVTTHNAAAGKTVTINLKYEDENAYCEKTFQVKADF